MKKKGKNINYQRRNWKINACVCLKHIDLTLVKKICGLADEEIKDFWSFYIGLDPTSSHFILQNNFDYLNLSTQRESK